jgi:uncharacterized protein
MKRRNITIQPTAFRFGPLDQDPKARLELQADELEALYLADYKGLYQEDCARELGVSRPTFAKIIKGARRKSVEMLIYGKGIDLARHRQSFTVVFPTNDRITIHPYFLTARYFAFAKIEKETIDSISYTANPVYDALVAQGVEITDDTCASGMAAGRMIPPLLKGAQILVVHELGEGMRRNVEGLGLNIEDTTLQDIDAVVDRLLH